jgi:hypothetical protein
MCLPKEFLSVQRGECTRTRALLERIGPRSQRTGQLNGPSHTLREIFCVGTEAVVIPAVLIGWRRERLSADSVRRCASGGGANASVQVACRDAGQCGTRLKRCKGAQSTTAGGKGIRQVNSRVIEFIAVFREERSHRCCPRPRRPRWQIVGWLWSSTTSLFHRTPLSKTPGSLSSSKTTGRLRKHALQDAQAVQDLLGRVALHAGALDERRRECGETGGGCRTREGGASGWGRPGAVALFTRLRARFRVRVRQSRQHSAHGRGHVQGQLACTKATDRAGVSPEVLMRSPTLGGQHLWS